MAITLTYGAYNFISAGPTPQVGIDVQYNRPYATHTIRVSGYFANYNDYAANQGAVDTLRTALATDNLTLVFHDGSNSIVNAKVKVVSTNLPVEWGQYLANYEVVFEYQTAAVVSESCTLCGYTFPQLPSFGRKLNWKRKSAQTNPAYITVGVILSGKFSGNGIDANMTLLNSLIAACDTTGEGTLVYGGQFSETVRVLSIDAPTDWAEDSLPFTVTCEYDTPIGGAFPDDIIDFETKQQVSEVYQRTAFHDIPYVNGRTTQSLGLSHFTVTFTGFFVGTTLAKALIAYRAEVATRAAGGILMPGSTRTEDTDAKRVDYSATYSYNVAATVAAQTSIR